MDFEWATFWAPPLTKESSEYVTDPPTVAPNVGTVSDNFAISTRARKDGVLDTAIDLLRFFSHPDNVEKVQGEIGQNMPNVKGDQGARPLRRSPQGRRPVDGLRHHVPVRNLHDGP